MPVSQETAHLPEIVKRNLPRLVAKFPTILPNLKRIDDIAKRIVHNVSTSEIDARGVPFFEKIFLEFLKVPNDKEDTAFFAFTKEFAW